MASKGSPRFDQARQLKILHLESLSRESGSFHHRSFRTPNHICSVPRPAGMAAPLWLEDAVAALAKILSRPRKACARFLRDSYYVAKGIRCGWCGITCPVANPSLSRSRLHLRRAHLIDALAIPEETLPRLLSLLISVCLVLDMALVCAWPDFVTQIDPLYEETRFLHERSAAQTFLVNTVKWRQTSLEYIYVDVLTKQVVAVRGSPSRVIQDG